MSETEKVRYIHYGTNEFDPDYYHGFIRNIKGFNKPIGGLWASRVDSRFGWKDWCELECYDMSDLNKHFEFTLKDDANIIGLETVEDILENLPLDKDIPFEPVPFIQQPIHPEVPDSILENYKKSAKTYFFDYEECLRIGIDAIELLNPFALKYELLDWDCECILVLNVSKVVPITNA